MWKLRLQLTVWMDATPTGCDVYTADETAAAVDSVDE